MKKATIIFEQSGAGYNTTFENDNYTTVEMLGMLERFKSDLIISANKKDNESKA